MRGERHRTDHFPLGRISDLRLAPNVPNELYLIRRLFITRFGDVIGHRAVTQLHALPPALRITPVTLTSQKEYGAHLNIWSGIAKAFLRFASNSGAAAGRTEK